MAAATQPVPSNIEYAQRAFKGFRVYGEGTIAVRKKCCDEVELCQTDAAALVIKAAQCSRYCHMAHDILHRKPAKQPIILDNTGWDD